MQNLEISIFCMSNLEISIFCMTNIEISRFGNSPVINSPDNSPYVTYALIKPWSVNPYPASVSRRGGGSHFRRPPRKGEQHGDSSHEPHRFSTLAMSATARKRSQATSKNCLVCDSKHAVEKCEKLLAMDVNQRAQLGKEKRLCFSCFESTDHQSWDCTRKKRCDMEGCDKYHHPLIHGAAPVFVGMPSVNNPPPVPPLNAAAPVFVRASSVNCVPTSVLLQIVPIVVATPKGVKVSTFALLDSGSQTLLILESFADAIALDGENGPLQLGTINSSGRPVCSRKVSFHVSWL